MRFAAKRAMSAEERMRRVLRGQACDYLPCGRSILKPGDRRDAIFIRRHAVSRRRKERLKTFQDVPLTEARGPYS